MRKDETDLFLAASHLKAYIHEGITLVKVYGGLSWTGKALTILMRASINQKFDKVCVSASQCSTTVLVHSAPLQCCMASS